jgi:hypothetical protein
VRHGRNVTGLSAGHKPLCDGPRGSPGAASLSIPVGSDGAAEQARSW